MSPKFKSFATERPPVGTPQYRRVVKAHKKLQLAFSALQALHKEDWDSYVREYDELRELIESPAYTEVPQDFESAKDMDDEDFAMWVYAMRGEDPLVEALAERLRASFEALESYADEGYDDEDELDEYDGGLPIDGLCE